MKRLLVGIVSVLSFMALPLMAQAASLNYAGMVNGATVKYSTDTANGTNPQTLRERNVVHMQNVLLTFNNASGIVRNGQMSFTRTGSGMWIGFGGAALAPTQTIMQGSLQCGGVITVDGDVTFDPATNTYTGTGHVIEFIGTMPINGVMKKGWAGGTFGTPDAGPGAGWMPGWGAGGNTTMPGWGGNVSNWGMMGGYVPVTSNPTPNGGSGGMTGGGGMMGPGGGPIMMGGTPGSGTGPGTGPGAGPGMMSQSVGAAAVGGSRAGMMRSWVNPTAAAMITVTNGTPDHTSPTPVIMSITVQPMQLNKAP